jgi:hypothetical protein
MKLDDLEPNEQISFLRRELKASYIVIEAILRRYGGEIRFSEDELAETNNPINVSNEGNEIVYRIEKAPSE